MQSPMVWIYYFRMHCFATKAINSVVLYEEASETWAFYDVHYVKIMKKNKLNKFNSKGFKLISCTGLILGGQEIHSNEILNMDFTLQ